MKIGIILGTRPEIIKLSPVIRECIKQNLDYFIIHTNQHYSINMDKIFFKDLNLPDAKYNLNISSFSQREQIGKMIIEIEKILLIEKPSIILLQGDTNSVLAGALISSRLNIKIGHIEAGLRSFDKLMPEEINRIITDHISDYLFVPTINQKEQLLKEGIDQKDIIVTGNTIVDSVYQNLDISALKKDILSSLEIEKNKYFLLTLHRPSNVDNKKSLEEIFAGLKKVNDKYKLIYIFPVHPRTKKMIQNFNLKIPDFIKVIEPLGYLDFLQLEANSKIIFTDSGGIQEEACILKIPSVTLRENTERPETINVKASILSGIDSEKILSGAIKMFNVNNNWQNPFGEGNSAEKIINLIK